MSKTEKKVRLGLIGLGNMGSDHTRKLVAGNAPRVEVTAVCDMNAERLAAFPDLETFVSSGDLIRSGAVDAVLVATPHYSHPVICIDALKAGLHVLVEKPIAVHKADCERLLAAHAGRKQVFAAMFNLRTNPYYIKIRELVRDGELGEIRRVNWIVTDWFRTDAYYASGGWRATWAGEGGGVLLNQCPHNLDLFQWIFGMPARVRAFCALGRYHKIEVEDDVTAYFEFKSGATAVFIASTGEAPGTNRLEVAGERGRLIYENGRITFDRNEIEMSKFSRTTPLGFAKPPVWNASVPVQGQGAPHMDIVKNFADAILDGTPLIAPGAEGIRSVELANAMILSSLEERTIEFPLDSRKYENKLKSLVKNSKAKKRPSRPARRG